MAKKRRNTRPALHVECSNTEDHPAHNWVPEYAKWPEGAFWRCRGRDNDELARNVRDTQRAVKKARKKR
ncbi:hypothetical protein ABZ281_28070 [Streptomyces sp. NPDC006265]|uniref:hypothetical protein n=1 Tax=Streptomyces sp. NPDC006265 TaxID=3156740 RepID=UPI0033A12E74